MTSLNEHDYSDLLGENPDWQQKTLIHDLDKVARRFDAVQMSEEEYNVIANALKVQVSLSPHSIQQPVRRSTKKIRIASVVALASLSCVILMAAALPNVAPLSQLLDWLDHTYSTHQVGKVVNLRQQACGFTMTIKRVYANSAQMIVAYDLETPKNHKFIASDFGPEAAKVTLSDDYGHTFPFSLTRPRSVVASGNDSGQLLNFDISELTTVPKLLSLHLNVPSLYALEEPGSPMMAGCETMQHSAQIPTPNSPMVQATTIRTAFMFNFTVPVQNGVQVMHLNKTVISNGISITLERVVITPADGAFVYVKDGNVLTQLSITVNGKEVGISNEVRNKIDEQVLNLANAPHSYWKLTYTSSPAMQAKDKFGRSVPGVKGVQAGPWIFTFTTP